MIDEELGAGETLKNITREMLETGRLSQKVDMVLDSKMVTVDVVVKRIMKIRENRDV